ncbi:hypothetical protein NHX12_012883, partial [Muraenolepis orangiensis]
PVHPGPLPLCAHVTIAGTRDDGGGEGHSVPHVRERAIRLPGRLPFPRVAARRAKRAEDRSEGQAHGGKLD